MLVAIVYYPRYSVTVVVTDEIEGEEIYEVITYKAVA